MGKPVLKERIFRVSLLECPKKEYQNILFIQYSGGRIVSNMEFSNNNPLQNISDFNIFQLKMTGNPVFKCIVTDNG